MGIFKKQKQGSRKVLPIKPWAKPPKRDSVVSDTITESKDSFSGTEKGVVPLDSTELAEKIKKLALEIVELSKQIDDSNIDYPY